jgi:hypothetical protein
MITVSSCVKMGRAVYIAVGPVIEPNDRFATVLTGERDYFHGPGTAATEGQRQTTEERRAGAGRHAMGVMKRIKSLCCITKM